MVVAVDAGNTQFAANLVELVAEFSDVAGCILVPGNHFINRVDDDGLQIEFLRPPDDDRRELVHRDDLPSEIPDKKIIPSGWRDPKRVINGGHAGITACIIDFQIDIQDVSFVALPAEPFLPFRDSNRQFNQSEGFSCLGWSCDQHLMALSQNPFNQFRSQRRKIVFDIVVVYELRKVVRLVLHPLYPGCIISLPDVCIYQELFLSALDFSGCLVFPFGIPPASRQTGQPGRVLVLRVDGQPIPDADLIHSLHAFLIFLLRVCIDVDNGVYRFTARICQCGNREL